MGRVSRGIATIVVFCCALAPSASSASSLAQRRASRPLVVVNANQSTNWSGYVQGQLEKGTAFHRVTGDWTVPAATQRQAGRAESSSSWIGIGGGCVTADCTLTDSTLIQAGTEQDVAANGQASYSAWWEIIPAPGIAVSFSVKAGDRMHADINETLPGLWSITMQNLTTGGSFSTTVPYTSTYGSVEWIVETPIVIGGSGTGLASMPNLSTTTFTAATANGAAAGLVASERMVLVDGNGGTVASPSNPGAGSNKFNVCTYATSCAAP